MFQKSESPKSPITLGRSITTSPTKNRTLRQFFFLPSPNFELEVRTVVDVEVQAQVPDASWQLESRDGTDEVPSKTSTFLKTPARFLRRKIDP